MQCTEYSKRRQNLSFASLSLTFIIGHYKTFPVFHADRVIIRLPCRSRSTFQNVEGAMWLANNGKGILFSVKQAFVGRDDIWAPLKTSAWEARPKQRSKISGILRGWHRAINLVLEMFADTVIYCLVQLAWGFPPRSKLMLRKVFQLAQPLFRQNLLMLKLMWQLVLNRMWKILRCMFMSGSNNREAAVLKDVITTGKRSHGCH